MPFQGSLCDSLPIALFNLKRLMQQDDVSAKAGKILRAAVI
jgi:hypothetical protein